MPMMQRRVRKLAQRGMSLVELMVGITVGLFVVAAAAMLVGSQLSDNRRLLLETQLQQDLRSSTDIIARELRRAGYWSQSEQGVWMPDVAPLPNPYAAVSLPVATEIEYRYIRDADTTGPFGFRVNAVTNTVQTRLRQQGGLYVWHDLTDPRTLRITALTITPDPSPDIVLPCSKPCADGTQDCWPRQVIRAFTVAITGQAVHDAAVQRTLQTTVRLRNDLVRFNDPLNPLRYCPA